MVAVNLGNLKERCRNGELDLSSCGLKEIPKEILNIKNLQALNLSNNKISSVGKFIGNITHLTKLDLSKNAIKGLPDSIGNLTNLKYLNLSHNQVATLPASIGNLKNLKHLDLKNNHLAQKFTEIVGPCQNESQCQQAAKNVLKLFSQSENDKKNKRQTGQDKKTDKNEKKAQNGNVTLSKQKDRKNKKEPEGIFGKLFSALFSLLKFIFMTILVIAFSVYILSFYDEPRYKGLKAQFLPVWQSTTSRLLTPEQTVKVEAALINAGTQLNNTLVTTGKMVVAKTQQFYVYITTDEMIQMYVSLVKKQASELWAKVSGAVASATNSATTGGNQKPKS